MSYEFVVILLNTTSFLHKPQSQRIAAISTKTWFLNLRKKLFNQEPNTWLVPAYGWILKVESKVF